MTPEELAVALARLEGKVDNQTTKIDNVVADVAEIRVQTTKTNGRVGALETKNTERVAAEAVRAELALVTKGERERRRSFRFSWVSAVGTIGGLVIGAVGAALAAGAF